jgi:hypothetical protein
MKRLRESDVLDLLTSKDINTKTLPAIIFSETVKAAMSEDRPLNLPQGNETLVTILILTSSVGLAPLDSHLQEHKEFNINAAMEGAGMEPLILACRLGFGGVAQCLPSHGNQSRMTGLVSTNTLHFISCLCFQTPT